MENDSEGNSAAGLDARKAPLSSGLRSGTDSRKEEKVPMALPIATPQDRAVIRRLNSEAFYQYGLPLTLASWTGVFAGSHLGLIKSTQYKLIPHCLACLLVSGLCGRYMYRDKLRDELSKLDTPLGAFVRQSFGGNLQTQSGLEVNSMSQMPSVQMEAPARVDVPQTKNFRDLKYRTAEPTRAPSGHAKPEERNTEPVVNKPIEKKKRYNKYGDEIMDP